MYVFICCNNSKFYKLQKQNHSTYYVSEVLIFKTIEEVCPILKMVYIDMMYKISHFNRQNDIYHIVIVNDIKCQ